MGPKLRQVEFIANFPDDLIWDDDGETVLRTNGLNVASAVAELLRFRGMNVDTPEEHYEHGWELKIEWNGDRFWIQVSVIDLQEAHILTADQTGLFARLIGRKSGYLEFLQALHDVLAADGRFDAIRWHPYISKPDLPGALSPTSSYPGPKLKQGSRRPSKKFRNRAHSSGGRRSAEESGIFQEDRKGPLWWTDLPLGPVGSFFARIHTLTMPAGAGAFAIATAFLCYTLGAGSILILAGYLAGFVIGIVVMCWFDRFLFDLMKDRQSKDNS